MSRPRPLSIVLIVAVGMLAGATASSASGAVTIGETFEPTQSFGGPGIFIQTGSPGDTYTVRSDGVITSWSFRAAASETSPLKLKMLRRVNTTDFMTVGDSNLETPVLGTLNTWPTRIAVMAGDVPAEFYSGDALSYRSPPGFVTQEIAGSPGDPGLDPPPGTTGTYEAPNPSSHQIDLSAVLEPDADRDGYGDETQDCAPADASAHTGCRAAALKRCKKRAHKHHWSHTKLKKCKKRALLLPPF